MSARDRGNRPLVLCPTGGGFIALGPDAEGLYVHASEIVSDNATKLLRAGAGFQR